MELLQARAASVDREVGQGGLLQGGSIHRKAHITLAPKMPQPLQNQFLKEVLLPLPYSTTFMASPAFSSNDVPEGERMEQRLV